MKDRVERVVVTMVGGEIVSQKSQSYRSKMSKEGYRFNSTKAGVTVYSDVPYPSDMTRLETGAMTWIARNNLVGDSGMIGYRSHGKIVAYTSSEIARLGGYAERQGRSFIKKMLRLGILQRLDTREGVQFYANPVYFKANGKLVPLNLFLLFQKDLERVLEPWVVKRFLMQAGERSLKAVDVAHEAQQVAEEVPR
jgi:hypothetical protein